MPTTQYYFATNIVFLFIIKKKHNSENISKYDLTIQKSIVIQVKIYSS